MGIAYRLRRNRFTLTARNFCEHPWFRTGVSWKDSRRPGHCGHCQIGLRIPY